jgi:cell fate regulator YaaT (PSP1 superfamily)
MARTTGVRFRQAGKVFYFDAGELEPEVGAYVVVETAYGLALGRVVIAPDQVIAEEMEGELKPILRLATEEDVGRAERLREKAEEGLAVLRRRVAERGLKMSLAGAEYDLEGRLFTAYFTAPERVDFRELVREVARELDVRVQLLQVGDRDRAKLVDGVDICGERLCCSSWLTSFPSVSIRMAKEQDLPLNPQKISGVCGRLYCCLTFEYEDYKALRGTLPKVGTVLSTPAGEAKLVSIDFVRERVRLRMTETGAMFDMAATDLMLQHGVTVRPMELVRRIEGEMRPILEDGRRRPARPGRLPAVPPPPPPEAAKPPTAAEAQRGPSEAPRRRRRRRRRRGGGGAAAGE